MPLLVITTFFLLKSLMKKWEKSTQKYSPGELPF